MVKADVLTNPELTKSLTVSSISIQQTAESRRSQVDFTKLPFGSVFADHMFTMTYQDGTWVDAAVVPYAPITMAPSMSALHYGQSIFEGMKAFRGGDGRVQLFRPVQHLKRLNRSARRLCMPEIPEDLFMEGLQTVVRMDADWVPEGGALYIRPIFFATEEVVGVHPSHSYKLIIFTCPVNDYYAKPLKVWVSTNYVRAADGGIGYVKTAGNYAASMLAGKKAADMGYNVVLWLDSINRKFIEEFSTMNAFFVVNDFVVTPRLSHTILEGVTRDSLITLMRDEGISVFERDISIEEIIQLGQAGMLKEAFGTGTAAVVAPVELIHYENLEVRLPPLSEWKIMPKAAQMLADIRANRLPDKHQWLVKV